MADIFIGLSRGVDGFKMSDFTVGSSTTATTDFELRIADADDQSQPIKRIDVQKALEAFERFLAQPNTTTSFPVL